MLRWRSHSKSPWGYLLPMLDDLPPLELLQDKASVGSDKSCTLRVDATALKQAASENSQCLFRVLRSKNTAKTTVSLRSESSAVSVNGEALFRGEEKQLEHGARIALGAADISYVYVDRDESESFKAPLNVLEKYFVGQRLGSGAFGKVYLLFDKELNYQRRAMKIVEPKNEIESRFAEREAEILKSLKHPCVIETYYVELLSIRQFLVMEFLAGGDLRQFVNDKWLLSEAQTKLIFFQVALAVSYLHGRNICHRDLKPDNILLQRRDPHTLIKVTDFGLAKSETDHSSLKTSVGTNLYMAPEMHESDVKKYTNAVDIWSMGVILFYSLTGALPFATLGEAIQKHHLVNYIPHRWRGVTSEAKMLVQRMLKAPAAQRPSVLQVLEDSWFRDDAMREKASQLTGIRDIKMQPTAHTRIAAPFVPTSPMRRVVIGLRGVMEYMKMEVVDTPDEQQQRRRGCVQTLCARPLFICVSVIFVCFIVLAGITCI